MRMRPGFDDLPGPDGLPLLGSALDFRRDPLLFYTRLAREHGRLAAARLGPRRCVLVNEPELIRRVFVDLDDRMRKGWTTRQLSLVLGLGLLTNEGEAWRAQRRLIQSAFHNSRIRGYAEVMTRRAAEALDRVMDRFEKTLRSLVPLPLAAPTPGNLRLRLALRDLDRLVREMVERRRDEGVRGEDLLSWLLRAQRESGAFDDRQLRDEVTTLLTAGHETTAIALSWTLWLLARHPEEEAAVLAELEEVLEGRAPSPEDAERLPRTRAAIDEGMRLYPPAWGVVREPLEEVELGGHRIPAGTQIFLVQWVTHRDPGLWSEPERFRPQRWLERERPPRWAYFPFGGGPRFCVGANFALMETMMILPAVLRRWRLEPVPGHPVEPQPAVTLRPRHGIRVVPRSR